MKYRIARDFFGDKHYVWCSEAFDSAAVGKYAKGAGMAASSNPYSIYRDLHAAVISNDHHCAKIAEQRKTLPALAVKMRADGIIDDDARDEIIAMVGRASLTEFSPYLYVVPCAAVASRAEMVPVASRAGSEREWIVPDLVRGEFDILEFRG